MAALCTTLAGTLELEGRDGIREPRARDTLLAELAPNFRCVNRGGTTYFEVPHDWTAERRWPGGRVDEAAAAGIREVLEDRGTKTGPIYADGLAELLDDHRLEKNGYLVPIEHWNAVMRDEPIGCWWKESDAAAILARARELGWQGG